MMIVTESLLEHEELNSFANGDLLYYKASNREHAIVLNDYTGDRYEVKFRIEEAQGHHQISERQGNRLLVGRYALYKNKTVYVRNLNGNGIVDVIETMSKMTHSVHYSSL